MRVLLVAALALLAACRIETAASGRPPGPPTAADSLARVEQDSALVAGVQAALRVYYARLAERDGPALRRSFWPGATVAARGVPPGERRPRVRVETIEDLTRRTPEAPRRLAALRVRMVHAHVTGYGDVANAWVVSEGRTDTAATAPARGIDAFHLVRDGAEWRIASLTHTAEMPGRRLEPPRRGGRAP